MAAALASQLAELLPLMLVDVQSAAPLVATAALRFLGHLLSAEPVAKYARV